MSIRVLLADDNECMLSAVRQLLSEEPQIEIVGVALSFAATLQKIADSGPDVVILDLHLAEEHGFTPDFVKSQLAIVKHVLAMSFSNDDEARALAESYGAGALLDKMNLYAEMIPAIMHCVGAQVKPAGKLAQGASAS
jgi:two-component system chemotaxis response regulator CheB